MEPVRVSFWNVPLWAQIGVYALGLLTLLALVAGVLRALRERDAGAAAARPAGSRWPRLRHALWEVISHHRIRRGASGKAHLAIFWGSVLLFLGTALATLDWDLGHHLLGRQFLTGRVYLAYKLTLDLAGLATLAGLAWGTWRRFALRDPRVEPEARFLSLSASLAGIIVSGYLVEALRLAAQRPAWAAFSPVGNWLAGSFAGLGPATLERAHFFLWLIHGLTALAFIAAIPLCFYSHIFKTPLALFWRRTEPRGALPKIADIESQESFGVSRWEQFSWLDRARFDGCVECGRCRAACPAARAGSELDPKELTLTLRGLIRRPPGDRSLIGDLVAPEAIWSCTTCGACARECPAEIPLVDTIVALRRHLALERGEFPPGLARALENTSRRGNPWGLDPSARLAWSRGLEVPRARPGHRYEVLYWVGCAASYDQRAQKIARAMARIFAAAGVDYAVMEEERCHGEFARRCGEEYLFQTAVTGNIASLSRYSFSEIVAPCPHCFNTLKNEYPQFAGGRFRVTSHLEYIARLLDERRLAPVVTAGPATVIHDPCYLARYHGIARDARLILAALGAVPREAPSRGCHALCCGAGGGQVFMERRSRTAAIRLDELRGVAPELIATACPYCLTMLESAAAGEGARGAGSAPIMDLAEIVARALPPA